MLPLKAPGHMPLHVKAEITHDDEMNDKIFDIDMNVWDNARNVIEPISFHRFDVQSKARIHVYIFDALVIDRLVSESCTQIRIIIASKCY
jgi:hypothetical protein